MGGDEVLWIKEALVSVTYFVIETKIVIFVTMLHSSISFSQYIYIYILLKNKKINFLIIFLF